MTTGQTLLERRKQLAARLNVPPDDFDDAQIIIHQVYSHHASQLYTSPRHLRAQLAASSQSTHTAQAPAPRRSGGAMGVRPLWLLVVMLCVLAAARMLLAAPPHEKPGADDQRRLLARSSLSHGPRSVWQFPGGARFRFTRISYGKYHCEPGARHGDGVFSPCQQPNPNLLFLYTPLDVPAGAGPSPVVVHFHGGAPPPPREQPGSGSPRRTGGQSVVTEGDKCMSSVQT